MATHKVGVEVGLDHILNGQARVLGVLDVLLDIAAWVNDGGLAICAPNKIRGVRKAA